MIKSKKPSYGNESISSLKGADRVRLRPGVIFGSDGIEGCQQSFFEILSNSIDEAREGFGSIIEVTRFKDRSIMVKDYGRGIPLGYNEKEKRFNWELIFCELYAGGKYNNNEDSHYEYSLGLNGLGCCATQYSSEYMEVTVLRDGKRYELNFSKGNNVGGLIQQKYSSESTGTTIKWRPDLEVFTDSNIPILYYQIVMKKQAVVNPGIRFRLYDEESGDSFEFFYEKGIVDYVSEVNNNKGFTGIQYYEASAKGKDREDKPEYRVKIQVAFCFNNEINLLEYYHNSSFLEHGGSPDRAVKTAFVYQIDRYLKTSGKYNKDESRIAFTDIQDSIVLVSNSFSTVTSYENQTKKSITNRFIAEAMIDFLKEKLEIYFIENREEAEKIAEQVLANKRSRETAEKTRINIRKKLSGGIDISNRVKKFTDCRTRDIEKRELYIVEGDSALGACKMARDAEFQAIMPVRGKILNCLKADYDGIFNNDIIVDLLKVLGCGVEIKSRHNRDLHTFEMNNLKWNKIIICTDADVDGYQIRTLILAMVYRLVPTLIKAEKVFIAESPLYEITYKDKSYFAYDDNEKNRLISKFEGKYSIQRSKGLGENEPEMMWHTTMNPQTRRLIQILPSSEELEKTYFDMLLGDNLQARKDFIAENGYKYMELIDVS